MDNLNIRQASLSDLDTLLTFQQGVVNAERPFDSTIKPGNIIYYDIAELINSADTGIFVAELEGEVIGCGYAQIRNAKVYLKHNQYIHLGFMYVLPDYRGQGVNSKIIDALGQWSLDRGITEIRLEVYAENASALKAYEKAGFSPHMLEMRMELKA
ncbi:GNAT family N-acetyltransferase [Mucilaginibacter agri]|uniref:GNAT family N-acetyltransferase n=1 Tax=Mucilaginibacter agri TaxID=2695265 RepID=A0A965ZD40_9SPHI|nr:GNAT family N-acetyltransferase [Mucilaginibacter agri]NCD68824.1 GNAT family N-acetyltransferase [Mucilaginibacter agri]